MTNVSERPPLAPGEPAPDFTLPAVGRDGDRLARRLSGSEPRPSGDVPGALLPVLTRAIAQLGVTTEKLKTLGVETLAIVATSPENARLYFRFRPTRAPLAADPGLITNRAFGLPGPAVTPELMQAMETVRVNPTGELPGPLPIGAALKALDRLQGYTPSAVDAQEAEQQFSQLKGQFLIDRDGIVRWVNVEGAREGLAGVGKFPTDEELVDATRRLAR